MNQVLHAREFPHPKAIIYVEVRRHRSSKTLGEAVVFRANGTEVPWAY